MYSNCSGGSSGDSRIKKVVGPLRGQGKSRGGQQSYLLYMYRTYVNQMNLNGKLRKKLGGHGPLRIATGWKFIFATETDKE